MLPTASRALTQSEARSSRPATTYDQPIGAIRAASSIVAPVARNAPTITRRTPTRSASRPTSTFRNSVALPSEIRSALASSLWPEITM